MKQQPLTHLPAKGMMLYEILYRSHYYDNDPRMPGNVPIDERFYVLARTHEEALRKSEPFIREKVSTQYQSGRLKQEVEKHSQILCTPVSLENLVVARKTSGDQRMGFFPIQQLELIHLVEEDSREYRLGVCLIPVNNNL